MMHYDDAHNSIADGDLILVRGRSWRSWFIRWWTQARFSHCGIAVWIDGGGARRLCVLEAIEGRGVQLLPFSVILERDRVCDWFGLWDELTQPSGRTIGETDEHAARVRRIQRGLVVAYGLRQWGKRYASRWQFFRSFSCLVRRLADRLGYQVDTDPDRFFCSEFVVSALAAGGFHPSRSIEPAEMSPGDVAELSCFFRKGTVTL